ncbi:hypothetical protein [Mucilaginibacter arboris]|uniref:Uncharacterized protein n=1 Tax=Mucilaginibacter arboris TaxID=2682090 RepID=A0A7K1T216_9SPHI|nr:hypothetical protein [Mucilaginibacter arboris]MVN23340.1 hypothetical protein [Mucilaginibacter arboris]
MKTLEDLQKEKLQAEIEKIKKETNQIKLSDSTKQTVDAKLEQDKIKAEIEKLKEETALIKKPWYSQPSFLNLLVSFSVPILSLLAAYYLAGGKEYFDAKTMNLQNQQHDIEQKVDEFKHRRDSLSKANINLVNENKSISVNQNKLQNDTAKLGNIMRQKQLQIAKYINDKKTLSNQINSLDQQKKDLGAKVAKISTKLLEAPFNEKLRDLINENDYVYGKMPTEFSILVTLYQNNKQFRNDYQTIIIKSIDSVKNIVSPKNFHLRLILQGLIYTCTREMKWKKELYTTADTYSNIIVKEKGQLNYFDWEIFADLEWKSKNERIEVFNFMVTCVRKLQAYGVDKTLDNCISIMSAIHSLN